MRSGLYISNLPFSLEDEALESALLDVLSAFGTVVSLRLIFEGTTLRPLGLCFAQMATVAQSESAVAALNGMVVAGHIIEVGFAGPHPCPCLKETTRGQGESSDEKPIHPDDENRAL